MLYRTFTESEVADLLYDSEGVATTHAGGRPGHARSLHLTLSNAELLARYDAMVAAEQARRAARRDRARERGRRWAPGGPIYVTPTAWSTPADMIEMGCLLLNSLHAQRGLVGMFFGEYAGDGTRLEVAFIAPRDVRMRYVRGATVATMPVRQLTMVIDRADRAWLRLHVQTFYGGAPLGALHNGAVLADAGGEDLIGFTGLPVPDGA
jgi:hypothetical protein